MTAWRVMRNDDGDVRAFVRFQDSRRLVVNPDGAWSVHDLDGRRLVCQSAENAARGMEAADRFMNPPGVAVVREMGETPVSRRMSVSMTLDAVRARQKTVTRRHVDTWKNLKPGDRLTLIEKGMGLPKGAKQVVVTEVEVTAVDVEPLEDVVLDPEETRREGLPYMTPYEFVAFWATSHGYKATDNRREILCRRIEWRYLDEVA